MIQFFSTFLITGILSLRMLNQVLILGFGEIENTMEENIIAKAFAGEKNKQFLIL